VRNTTSLCFARDVLKCKVIAGNVEVDVKAGALVAIILQ
jgi:hypothetical protein